MSRIVDVVYHYFNLDSPTNILCFDYAEEGSCPDLTMHVVGVFKSKKGYLNLMGQWKIKYKQ